MFSFSFYKFLVILLVMVILFKPKDLGKILFVLGSSIKKIKKFFFKMQTDLEDIAVLGNLEDYEIKEKSIKKD